MDVVVADRDVIDEAFFEDRFAALGYYHPYWISNLGQKKRNPDFDDFSGQILNVKKRDHPYHRTAVDAFAYRLSNALRHVPPRANEPLLACVVPSHKAGDCCAGLVSILEALGGAVSVEVVPQLLMRHKTINKLTGGGDRSIAVHLGSVRVTDPGRVEGRRVLLLDDVSTTGNSLRACHQLLMASDAEMVLGVVLGRTTYEHF